MAAQGKSRNIWRRSRAAARIARAAYDRFDDHDGTAMAGYVAFSVFLSLFPFAIFFSALAGIIIGPDESQQIIDELFALAPQHIAQTLEPVLRDVIGKDRGGVLTFSFLGAIWVASNAVEAIRIAFDRAYEAGASKGFLQRRATAIGFVAIAGVTFTLLGILIIVAPLAISLAEQLTGLERPDGIGVLRYGLGLLGFMVFLYFLHRWLPSRAPKTRDIWPGILVTTALWIAGASAFSVYLAFAPSYTLTYGAFAGVIVTLLFFYLTSAVLILGAEVNAALLAQRPGTVTEQTEEV